MPLVPLHYIQGWYKTSSPVYRQFAFAFKNRLWDKPIPKGMAVCGFWWLSVFSVLILRPLVGGVLIARWLARILHLSDLLRWTDKQSMRVIGQGNGSLGLATLLVSLLGVMVTFLLMAWGLVLSESIDAQIVPLFILAHVILVGAPLASYADNQCLYPKQAIRTTFRALSILVLGAAAFARPDLWAHIMSGAWLIVSYLGGGLWSWIISLCVGMGSWLGDLLFALWAYWPFYVGCLALLALSAATAYRVESSRTYLKESYLSVRLRKTRAAILEAVSHHVAQRLGEDLTVPCSRDFWQKRTLESRVAYALICQIVDSEAWTKVDLTRLSLSISPERLTQIGDEVLAEWRSEQEGVKRQKAWDRRMATISAHMAALNTYVHETGAYRLLHEVAKQLTTLGCVIWEVYKSRSQGWCPYLSFISSDQPADQQADAQVNQPAA